MDSSSKKTESQIAAISALYSAERQELSSLLGHALALISVAVGYLAVAAAVWTATSVEIPGWLFAFLPLPALAAVGFHALLNALVFAHNASADILEGDLLDAAGYSSREERLAIGARPGRTVTDVGLLARSRERFPLAVATAISYGVAGFIVIGFTAACLVESPRTGWQVWITVICASTYTAIAFFLAMAWRLILSINMARLIKWGQADMARGSPDS